MHALRTIVFAFVITLGALGQTFTLGLSTDPCTGGSSWSFAGGTLRFGDFVCTLPTGGPGAFVVQVDMVEPVATLTAVGARVFDLTIADTQGFQVHGSLHGVDLAKLAPAGTIVSRSFLVLVGDPRVTITVHTIVRSGVLSRVTITPVALMLQ